MPPPVAEDDQKRRARRRLIGAVALTLLAVIILPLVLEDEPPPTGALQVHMPASTAQTATPQAPAALPDTIEFAPPASNMQVESDEPQPEQREPDTSIPATSTPARPVVTEKTVKAAVNTDSVGSQKTEPKAESGAGQKSAIKTEAKSATVKAADAKSAETKTGKSSGPTQSAYSVQIGVFTDQANVEKLKMRVSALGMKATTEKLGTSTRVRVGTYAERDQADAAAKKLKAAGLSAQVVEK